MMDGRKLYISITYLLLVFFGLSLSAQENQKDLELKRKNIKAEIAYTNKLINEVQTSKKVSINKLNLVVVKINQRNNLLATYKLEINTLNNNIETTELTLQHLNNDLSLLKKEYAKIAWYAYQYKTAYNKLIFLFSAESLNQAYQRMRYLDQLSAYMRNQANKITTKESEKRNTLLELKQKKEQLSQLLRHENDEMYVLEKERLEKKKITKSLSGQEKTLKTALHKKQKEANKLAKKIEAVISAKTRPVVEKGKTTKYTLTPEEKQLSTSFFANKGKLPWPLQRGVISETYGVHNHPVLKRVKTKNNGINLATSKNSEARCVFNGKIASVTKISNTNLAVIVKHGDYFTVYSNLDQVFVQEGDMVKTLQLLGRVHTNLKEETELHFEVRKGAIPQNPKYWITK